jgi:hypothetical protein
MNAPLVPPPGQEPPMGETVQSPADAPAPSSPSMPRRLLRWWARHPATASWLSLIGFVLMAVLLARASPSEVLALAILLPVLGIGLWSFVRGVIAVFRDRHRPAWKRVLQGLALVALPALIVGIVLPNFLAASRRSKTTRAASDTRAAVSWIVAFGNEKGRYPSSLKVLRDSGYLTMPDEDPWGQPFVLAPILSEGRTRRDADDVYVYSRGPCGTGTYEPTRWKEEPGWFWNTGECGAVGYSSMYGSFIGRP